MHLEPALPDHYEEPKREGSQNNMPTLHMVTNESFTKEVDEGAMLLGGGVPLPEPFRNENGAIQNLLTMPCRTVTAIESKAGAIRANHYHRTDWHYAYVVRGRVSYYERAIGSTEIPEPTVFRAGEMFFTPPMREHAMRFEEDSTIITMAKNARTHEEHEADVVRVDFIKPGVFSVGEQNGPR